MDFFDEIFHTLQDAKFYRNKNKMPQYKALINTVIDMLEKDICSDQVEAKPKKLAFLRERN